MVYLSAEGSVVSKRAKIALEAKIAIMIPAMNLLIVTETAAISFTLKENISSNSF